MNIKVLKNCLYEFKRDYVSELLKGKKAGLESLSPKHPA